jgi:FkbM family methyltransferase
MHRYNVDIFAFDPTPVTSEWLKNQQLPENFHFYNYGISNYDGAALFYQLDNPSPVSLTMLKGKNSGLGGIDVNVFKLKTIMEKLQHKHIDLLKMDIEGEEYPVLENILNDNIQISQIIIEFHHRFKNIGIKKTKNAVKLLNDHNFKIFSISSLGEDYSFIKDE